MIFFLIIPYSVSKRHQCSEKQHYDQECRGKNKSESAEEERQSCKTCLRVRAGNGKHHADERQRQTCDIQASHEVAPKHGLYEIRGREEEYERSVNHYQKSEQRHHEPQNQHDFSRRHIRIGLRLSRLRLNFFCHILSIQPHLPLVNTDRKNASVFPKHIYVESESESAS